MSSALGQFTDEKERHEERCVRGGQRVEIYSKTIDDPTIYRTYLDLDRIKSGDQLQLTVTEAVDWSADFAHLMQHEVKGARKQPYESGTLVIWRKIDRLAQGGRFGDSVEERLQGLRKFVARAYRRFIANGLCVELEGEPIWLHDPLFLLETKRVTQKFKGVTQASIIDQGSFPLDGKKVSWTVTLLPKQFRRVRGSGGRAGKGREDFSELYIPENESKISMLRNSREIYYDLVPRLYPGGKDKIDRYIGVEVEFPAALDEYFQVRNVKRGAEPVSKLREELRKALKKPIETARKRIRDYWREVEQEAVVRSGDIHKAAHDIIEAYQVTALDGRANMTASQEEIADRLRDVITDMGLDPDEPEAEAAMKWLRDSFAQRSLTMVDAGWPGKELLEIEHLTGKVIAKINRRHPFVTTVLAPLRAMAEKDPDDLDTTGVSELLRKSVLGINLLLLAYAKAENMVADPDDRFSDLRSDWGKFAHGMLREAAKSEI